MKYYTLDSLKAPNHLAGYRPHYFFLRDILIYSRSAGRLHRALRRGQVVHHPVDGDRADSEGVKDAAEPHPRLEGGEPRACRGLRHAAAAAGLQRLGRGRDVKNHHQEVAKTKTSLDFFFSPTA